MNFIRLFSLFVVACAVANAEPSPAAPDPLAGSFYPPELILLAHAQIGLTPEQQASLHTRVQNTQGRAEELRQQLEKETAALGALARQDKVDESAVVAQLDRVLDVERGLKHLQIGLLAWTKNLLTTEQLGKLREVAKGGGSQVAEDMRRRLTDKVAQVEAGAHAWEASGRDTSAIAQAMQERVKPLLDSGKPLEAEAELDRLLEQLKPEAK